MDDASKLRLHVELLPTQQGGRSNPASLCDAKWRPHLRVSPSSELLGVAFTSGPAQLAPGAWGEAVAELVYADKGVDYSALQPGISADILEGSTVVGRARVL
jgi:hypothetical protein